MESLKMIYRHTNISLKDEIIKLFEDNGVKVEKVRGKQRTLFKANGNLLYITYKEKIDEESEKENYYLQVNKGLVSDTLSKYGNLTILVICGSLSQILVIDGKDFLELTSGSKEYSDKNVKFNVFITKRKADFQIRLTDLGFLDVNKYVNAFDKCSLTDKVSNILVQIQQSEKSEIISVPKSIETPQIRFIRKEVTNFNKDRVKELFRSGDGNKFENFIKSFFDFLGFEIDTQTSGQNGELDVVCLTPMQIGIECRSTRQNVGVDILDELNRHIRRYENKSGLSGFIGLVICDKLTPQLIEDIKTEKRYFIDSETIIALMQFSFNYPFSPMEFSYFFSKYGNIQTSINTYLESKMEKIRLRESIVSIFENVSDVMEFADIKAYLKIAGFKTNDEELNKALTELTSPFLNWLENIENKYRLIFPEAIYQNQQNKSKEIIKWMN
jgi:hypothetical protein